MDRVNALKEKISSTEAEYDAFLAIGLQELAAKQEAEKQLQETMAQLAAQGTELEASRTQVLAKEKEAEELTARLAALEDEFKKFNDMFGHKVGDLVLQIVAAQCKKSIRGVDVLARRGGEEFIILLPRTELEDAILVAKRLREFVENADLYVAREFLVKATGSSDTLNALCVTVSVGVTTLDDSCTDIDILVDHADRAMYAVKNSGRNNVSVWNLFES